MADDLITELRAENESLLRQLKRGVNSLKRYVNEKKIDVYEDVKIAETQTYSGRARNKLNFTGSSEPAKITARPRPKPKLNGHSCGLDNESISRTKQRSGEGNRILRSVDKAVTSTPMVSNGILESEGNQRRKLKTPSKTPKSAMRINHPRSILVTPDTRKAQKEDKHRVTFPGDTIINESKFGKQSMVEKSFLGYDWIAGLLDNESNVTDEPEKYFEEIKEFRRVNRDECINSKSLIDMRFLKEAFCKNLLFNGKEWPIKAGSTSDRLTPKKFETKSSNKENLGSGKDICCGSTYTIDNRLYPVPIHGPYSQCPVCQTKSEPESEYESSYVRVSVPRASLQSPYRVRAHRRKSYDPSDSVALSEHCLAGWQCARPAYAPGPDSLDLKSNSKHGVASKNMVSELSRDTCNRQDTEQLLNTTISMSYGLQLLEKGRNIIQR